MELSQWVGSVSADGGSAASTAEVTASQTLGSMSNKAAASSRERPAPKAAEKLFVGSRVNLQICWEVQPRE